MKKLHLSSVFILILFLFACKKETDNTHPLISIQSPSKYSSYQVLDTIPVIASITDDSPITNVKIVLTDNEFRPMLASYNYTPNTTVFNLDVDYPLNDYYLENGDYYLLIQATDGKNPKNQYQQIEIIGFSKELKGIVVISKQSSNAFDFILTAENNQQHFLFQVSGDYAASAINSRNNQIYWAGKNSININAYNLLDYSIDWQLPLLINPPMHSENCLYFDEYLFSTFRNDYIRGFDVNGTISFTTSIEESALNKIIYRHNDLILVDQQSKTNAYTYITSYYLTTGIEKQRRQSNFETIAFLSHSIDELFIVANNDIEGLIMLYDPYLNVLSPLKSIPEKFNSALQTEAGVLILSSTNKIWQYEYSSNQINEIENVESGAKLLFESLRESIIVVGEMSIRIYSYPEFVLETTNTFNDSIVNAHLYYNK